MTERVRTVITIPTAPSAYADSQTKNTAVPIDASIMGTAAFFFARLRRLRWDVEFHLGIVGVDVPDDPKKQTIIANITACVILSGVELLLRSSKTTDAKAQGLLKQAAAGSLNDTNDLFQNKCYFYYRKSIKTQRRSLPHRAKFAIIVFCDKNFHSALSSHQTTPNFPHLLHFRN